MMEKFLSQSTLSGNSEIGDVPVSWYTSVNRVPEDEGFFFFREEINKTETLCVSLSLCVRDCSVSPCCVLLVYMWRLTVHLCFSVCELTKSSRSMNEEEEDQKKKIFLHFF